MSETGAERQPVEDGRPPRRSVIVWSASFAAAVVALVAVGSTALVALPPGIGVTITYSLVLGGIYVVHLVLCGWRLVVAALLAAPSFFLGGTGLVAAREQALDDVTFVVGVSSLLAGLAAWGTVALAVVIRNRWGNTDGSIWHLFP